MITKSSRSD